MQEYIYTIDFKFSPPLSFRTLMSFCHARVFQLQFTSNQRTNLDDILL